jgi:hypothetical protein
MSFVCAREYLALPRAPETWIVQDILPASGLLNIYGPPKAGKTYAVLDLAMAISDPARERFLEWPVRKHGLVWYLQIDTPRGLFMRDYLEKIISGGHNLNGVSFADIEMVPYPFNILGDGKMWLKKALDESPETPVALVVDTLRDSHGADENDSGVMRNVIAGFIDALMGARGERPALVLLTHQKKLQEGTTIDLMDGGRGSNYVAGRMDTVLRIASNEIKGKGRILQETTLLDYVRDKRTGLWVKFDKPAEIQKYLMMDFPSAHARHQAFAKEWGYAPSTAQNWFDAFNGGSPTKKKNH